jgi:hypothetical protein
MERKMLKTVSLTGAMRQNAGQESEKCLIGEVRMDSMRQNGKKKAKNSPIERSYETKCRARE